MAPRKASTKAPAKAPKSAAVSLGEPARPSASLEVLGELNVHDSLTTLDARMDSLEIDIARESGSREDDVRRLTGEMAVMRARLDDALNAVHETASEIRSLTDGFDQRLRDTAARALTDADAGRLRTEVRAGIDGMMSGVGDVLGTLTDEMGSRVEALGARIGEVQSGLEGVAEAVRLLGPLGDRLERLEAAVAALRPAE
ncbi:MAG TPA: hypothetical protein VGB83_10180 [Actinomycetota bacterium]